MEAFLNAAVEKVHGLNSVAVTTESGLPCARMGTPRRLRQQLLRWRFSNGRDRCWCSCGNGSKC